MHHTAWTHHVSLVLATIGVISVNAAHGFENNLPSPADKALRVIVLAQASKEAVKRPAPKVAAELNELVAAAKSEGELMFYSSEPEEVSKQVAATFLKKYGIKAVYLRGSSNPLMQRYSAEAEANNVVADLILQTSNSVAFAEDGINKGWMESVSEANLPILKTAEFPKRFLTGPTAIVHLNPYVIAINTDKVKLADAPKDWADILNPRFQGQIIVFDPAITDPNYYFWEMILDQYGESFFTKLRAQAPRWSSGGIPASQALVAGEGGLNLPATVATFSAMKEKGAPISVITPSRTLGPEFHAILTHRSKAKHPNAGRLFVNYIMTREGNIALTKDSGGFSIYDTRALPKQYESLPSETVPAPRKERVRKLLGIVQ